MSTTWAQYSSHIRHPWFDTVMAKRKHRDTVSPDEELPSSRVGTSSAITGAKPTSPPPAKRRRCSLENGFAHLSLNSTPSVTSPPLTQNGGGAPSNTFYYAESASSASTSPTSQDGFPHVQDVSAGVMDAEPYFVGPVPGNQDISPYTVEEPQIPEVNMKTSSWYEPERDRIVVTDIDSFAQSDDEGEDNGGHHINPALLNRIRTTAARSAPSVPSPNPSTSQALVLFKPLPIMGDELERVQAERARLAREAELAVAQPKVEEDDAMDVEP